MIFKKHIFLLAATFAAFVGCAPEEKTPADPDSHPAPLGEDIRLSVKVEGAWTGSDGIGLFIPSREVENLPARWDGGVFKATVPTPSKGDAVYAYYPYSEAFLEEGLNVRIPSETDGKTLVDGPLISDAVQLQDVKEETEINLALHPVTGTVKIIIRDNPDESLAGEQISRAVLTVDKTIAGLYSVDVTGGRLVPVSRENALVIAAESPIAAEGVTYVASALPGKYAGELTLVTSAGEQSFPHLAFDVKAGGTTDIPVTLKAPVKPHVGIYTADDYNAFIASVIAGDYSAWVTAETGEVDIMEDLVFEKAPDYPSGEEGAAISFDGVLDGNGHSLSCQAWVRPLLNVLGKEGVVKNLHTQGAFKSFANSGQSGNASIAKINLGLIENCTSDVSVDLETVGGTVLGAICAQNGGVVKSCTNLADVTVRGAFTAAGAAYGGGISALGHTVLGNSTPTRLDVDETCSAGSFIDCENKGDITFVAAGQKVTKSSFGGICGLVYMNGVRFENCINRGRIARTSDGEVSSNACNSIGGILGRSAAWYTASPGDSGALETSSGYDTRLKDCANYGTVYTSCRHSAGIVNNASGARLDAAGGIVGVLIGDPSAPGRLEGCTHEGEVSGGWNISVNTTALGGLVGTAKHAVVASCNSRGKISAIGAEKPIGAAGGVAAFVLENVAVTGGIINVSMDLWQAGTKPLLYGLAFGNVVTSASISGTTVSGSISVAGEALAVTEAHLVSAGTKTQPNVSEINWNL